MSEILHNAKMDILQNQLSEWGIVDFCEVIMVQKITKRSMFVAIVSNKFACNVFIQNNKIINWTTYQIGDNHDN